MRLTEIWAKTDPFQSVLTHGIVSGVAAQELLSEYVAQGIRERLCQCLNYNLDQATQFVGYLTSLHDIGKINPYFQAMDPHTAKWMKEEGVFKDYREHHGFRHEQETVLALIRIWEPVLGRRETRKYTEILKAHHQGKESAAKPVLLTSEGVWADLQVEFEERMRRVFLSEEERIPVLVSSDKSEDNVVRALLLGIVILADWISSGTLFADAEDQEDLVTYARVHMHTFLRESNLLRTKIDFGKKFCEVWPNIPEGKERELQKKTQQLFDDIGDRCSLLLMEAPMGEGKTEAGVYGAIRMAQQWGKDGFYIALPTAATANQMVARMRELLKHHDRTDNVRLLHGNAWMEEPEKTTSYATEDERFAQQWLTPLRLGMLAPFAVGTVDQAMMAAMFVKYGILRLLGLAEKALVIDEIHAYDTYMQNILEGLLEWCKALEIPVVLLSATLPQEKKRQLLGVYTKQIIDVPYPAITAVTESGNVKIIPIKKVTKQQCYEICVLPVLNNTSEIAHIAMNTVAHGGCLCILMNTVGQAQKVFQSIRNSGFDGEVLLFHSRFTAGRRQGIEEKCIRLFGKDKSHRPAKAILVATQVVEQSLDVDFDFFFSAVAPIDLLIQRMGRQFRHGETPRPSGVKNAKFTVLIPEGSSFCTADRYVYPECLLKRTVSLLQNRVYIRIPEDIAQLVADGYDPGKVPTEELEKWFENKVSEEIRGASADPYKLGKPEKSFRPFKEVTDYDDLESQNYLSAQTRLSDPTVTVALINSSLYQRLAAMEKKGRIPVSDTGLARMVRLHSVSLRKGAYDKALQKHPCPVLEGDMLLYGVYIMEAENSCLVEDPELGILEKEGEYGISL